MDKKIEMEDDEFVRRKKLEEFTKTELIERDIKRFKFINGRGFLLMATICLAIFFVGIFIGYHLYDEINYNKYSLKSTSITLGDMICEEHEGIINWEVFKDGSALVICNDGTIKTKKAG